MKMTVVAVKWCAELCLLFSDYCMYTAFTIDNGSGDYLTLHKCLVIGQAESAPVVCNTGCV